MVGWDVRRARLIRRPAGSGSRLSGELLHQAQRSMVSPALHNLVVAHAPEQARLSTLNRKGAVPKADILEWHRTQVFRGEARE